MKKLVFLIAVLMVAMGLQAQDQTGKINVDQSYKLFTVDETVTDTAQVTYVVNTRVNYPFTLDAGVMVDLTSGTVTTDTLFIEGRKDGDEAWTPIANGVWGGVDDTNIIVSYTTAVRYREIRIRYAGLDDAAVRILKDAWLKIWYE